MSTTCGCCAAWRSLCFPGSSRGSASSTVPLRSSQGGSAGSTPTGKGSMLSKMSTSPYQIQAEEILVLAVGMTYKDPRLPGWIPLHGDVTVKNLKATFEKLGVTRVHVKIDPKGDELCLWIHETIDKECQDKEVKWVVFTINCHGTIEHYIMADGGRVSKMEAHRQVDHVRMKSKAKLHIADACQEKETNEPGLVAQGKGTHPTSPVREGADTIIGFATNEGNMSYADEDIGGVYTHEFCRALEHCAEKEGGQVSIMQVLMHAQGWIQDRCFGASLANNQNYARGDFTLYLQNPNPIRLLILGEAGHGKSTIINGLRDPKLSPEPAQTGKRAKGITKKITKYLGNINGQVIEVYDTPGIGDGDVKPARLVSLIEQELLTSNQPDLQGVLVTQPVGNDRLSLGSRVVRMLVEQGFVANTEGHGKWENVILVGTKDDLADEESRVCFKDDITQVFFEQTDGKVGQSVLVNKDNFTELGNAILRLPNFTVKYSSIDANTLGNFLGQEMGMDGSAIVAELKKERKKLEVLQQEHARALEEAKKEAKRKEEIQARLLEEAKKEAEKVKRQADEAAAQHEKEEKARSEALKELERQNDLMQQQRKKDEEARREAAEEMRRQNAEMKRQNDLMQQQREKDEKARRESAEDMKRQNEEIKRQNDLMQQQLKAAKKKAEDACLEAQKAKDQALSAEKAKERLAAEKNAEENKELAARAADHQAWSDTFPEATTYSFITMRNINGPNSDVDGLFQLHTESFQRGQPPVYEWLDYYPEHNGWRPAHIDPYWLSLSSSSTWCVRITEEKDSRSEASGEYRIISSKVAAGTLPHRAGGWQGPHVVLSQGLEVTALSSQPSKWW